MISRIILTLVVVETVSGDMNTQGGSEPIPFPPPHNADQTESKGHIFQLGFYSRYFDLDSETFFIKLARSTNPFDSSFAPSTESGQREELYGFFWITATLVFLVFVSSTGSNILASWLSNTPDTRYEYSFDLLTITCSLFYGYTLIVPTALWAVTSFILHFPRRLNLIQLISFYGYTNILWFPITLINFLIVVFVGKNHPLATNLMEWIIVMVSGLITGMSNLVKISPLIKQNCVPPEEDGLGVHRKQYFAIIGCLAILHMGFAVLVKVTFFGIKV